MRFLILLCISFFVIVNAEPKDFDAYFVGELEKSWSEVLNYAQEHLPQRGTLLMTDDGFGYLKVDDDYIHTLFPMIDVAKEGYKKPPYFRSAESPGAHISVFYVDEHIRPEEIGQEVNFTLKEIVIVQPTPDTRYVVLQIESKELEHMREKYGLSPKLHDHEFHISLAKKKEQKNQYKRNIPTRTP